MKGSTSAEVTGGFQKFKNCANVIEVQPRGQALQRRRGRNWQLALPAPLPFRLSERLGENVQFRSEGGSCQPNLTE